MNLLLLRPEELDDHKHAHLSARRARHLRDVLGVAVGQQVVAGCLGQSIGHARVEALSQHGDEVVVHYQGERAVPKGPEKSLLLAVPRPKVLSRCLEHASALGFTQIVLFRSYRVDKAHLLSRKLDDTAVEPHLLLGLEQGRRVHLPRVVRCPLFKPFVEDQLSTLVPRAGRYVAHPKAATTLCGLRSVPQGYSLAIGPEGGFIDYEVEALSRQGFVAVAADTGPLRVESALSYLTGQLDLLSSAATSCH